MLDLKELKSKILFNLYFRAFQLLKSKEKPYLFYLICSSLLNGFLQFFALVGVIPLINLIIDKEKFYETKVGVFIINNFQIEDINHLLLLSSVSLILVIVFKNFYAWFHVGLIAKFIANIEIRMRDETLNEVIYSKFEWISSYNSNYLREVVFNYAGAWSSQFIKSILILKNEFLVLLFILFTLIYMDPFSAITIIFFSIVISYFVILISRKKLYFLEEKKRSSFVKAAHLLINAFQGIKDIKMSQSEYYFKQNFNKLSKVAAFSEASRQQWQILPRLIIESFAYCLVIFVLIAIIFYGDDIRASASILAVYAFAAFRIMPIVSQFVTNINSIINVTPLLEQLMKIKKETGKSDHNNQKSINIKKTIEFKNLSFQYHQKSDFILSHVNIKLKRGNIYGLVGLSGAGKSTLINLMSGILYPTDGEILIDGNKINIKQIKYLRNFINYVGQDPYIFDGSIEENIVFSSNLNELDKQFVVESLIKAQLSEWVENKKIKKIELGERGNKLSGGQRQRLSIARAFYNKSDLVIFDEGTSALDGIQESYIKNILIKLKSKSIVFLIAHKISSIQNCDKIFVLENGTISDVGTHKELTKRNNFYKNVVLNQMIK